MLKLFSMADRGRYLYAASTRALHLYKYPQPSCWKTGALLLEISHFIGLALPAAEFSTPRFIIPFRQSSILTSVITTSGSLDQCQSALHYTTGYEPGLALKATAKAKQRH